jgi:hypothetical protein
LTSSAGTSVSDKIGELAFQISAFEAAAGQERPLPELQTSVSYAKLPTTFVGRGPYGKSHPTSYNERAQMSLANLGPDELVPKTGVYYCVMCHDVTPFLRRQAAESMKEADPKKLEEVGGLEGIYRAMGVSNTPITRKRFKAGDKFGVCPQHKTSTGWTLEKEEITTGKKGWQFWK